MSLPTTRRDFLGKACVASACGACAFAVVPAVSYLIPNRSPLPSGPVDVGTADIPEGSAREVQVGLLNLLLIRMNGRFTAVNRKCTHLACLVKWDDKDKIIRCRCHGASFESDGAKPTAPAPRPLPSFPVRTEGNRIIVLF
jgi:cytochrome b6-f complex iron-sulfur subunit